jgi:hypothetical protein
MSKHEIGSSLAVANGDVVKIIKCLTPHATDTDSDVNVYEVEHADGHHDVMASDNGSVWIAGDENNSDVNQSQFEQIVKANGESVLWDEIEDDDLREWIADRRKEYKDYAEVIDAVNRISSLSADTYDGRIVIAVCDDIKLGNEIVADYIERTAGKEIMRKIKLVEDDNASSVAYYTLVH